MIIPGKINKPHRQMLGYPHLLVLPIETILIATLVSMHRALADLLQGHEKAAVKWLEKVSILLRRINPKTRPISTGSISDKWLYLRHTVAETICELYSHFGRRHKFIRGMLGWNDDGENFCE